jgi:hypothetical protein
MISLTHGDFFHLALILKQVQTSVELQVIDYIEIPVLDRADQVWDLVCADLGIQIIMDPK